MRYYYRDNRDGHIESYNRKLPLKEELALGYTFIASGILPQDQAILERLFALQNQHLEYLTKQVYDRDLALALEAAGDIFRELTQGRDYAYIMEKVNMVISNVKRFKQ